jgi:membrane protein YqaA with SNARE-associated domain
MRLFKGLYERAILWAAHTKAPWYLGFLSFIEAIFFPVMPEVMMAPMCLAKPKEAYRYATISLISGLGGSLLGYALGHYAYEVFSPMLSEGMRAGIDGWVQTLRVQMNEHWLTLLGVLVVAALQPVIPMKVVAWASGIVGIPIGPYLACMAVGRGKRLYLLAAAIRWGGERAEAALRRNIERLGWVVVALVVVGVLVYLLWR